MRIVWATDIHFDMAEPVAIQQFFRGVKDAVPDALLLAGDISTAGDVDMTVDWIASEVDCPIFFVLGNHDYYGGSIGTVRRRMRALTTKSMATKWLPAVPGVVELGSTILVGHDGWYDGGCGDPRSTLRLRDFDEIDDLVGLHREARDRLTRWLAEDGAAQLAAQLASSTASSVLVVTHVPPFQDASRHRGERSSGETLPFYCNTALGRVLTDFAIERQAVDIRVLCGHTHDRYDVDILPNLHISVGGAEYGSPEIGGVLEIA
jgi:predicted phosphohydrolase